MRQILSLGAAFALGVVVSWAFRQLGVPWFLIYVLSGSIGIALGCYLMRLETLTRRNKEHYEQ